MGKSGLWKAIALEVLKSGCIEPVDPCCWAAVSCLSLRHPGGIIFCGTCFITSSISSYWGNAERPFRASPRKRQINYICSRSFYKWCYKPFPRWYSLILHDLTAGKNLVCLSNLIFTCCNLGQTFLVLNQHGLTEQFIIIFSVTAAIYGYDI